MSFSMILIFGSVLTKQFLFVGCAKSSLFSPLTPVHSRPLNSPATIWKTFLAFTTIFISDFSLFYVSIPKKRRSEKKIISQTIIISYFFIVNDDSVVRHSWYFIFSLVFKFPRVKVTAL